MSCAGIFNLTGDYCINRGEQLQFSARITGANVTGAVFVSEIIRNFDKQIIATFNHEVTNSGISEVTYTLPISTTSGIDYAASSFKSTMYPSGAAPLVLMTGTVNINI